MIPIAPAPQPLEKSGTRTSPCLSIKASWERSKFGFVSVPRMSALWHCWQYFSYAAFPRSTTAGSSGGRAGA